MKREVLIGHETRWKKGQQPKGAGRPKGTRDRISTAFLTALAEDFEAHGKKALQTVREEDPSTYLRVVASLQPKEIAVTAPLSGMDDSKLEEALSALTMALQANMPSEEEQPAVLN